MVIGGEANPVVLGEIKRDIAGRQVVTVDDQTGFTFEIPLINLEQLIDNARSTINLLTALTTPVPENVAAQGPVASDYFRRIVASGVPPDQAAAALGTPEIQAFIRAKENIDSVTEAYAAQGLRVPPEVVLAIANGEKIDFSNGIPEIVREGCANGASALGCRFALSQMGYPTNDPAGLRDRAILVVDEAETKIASLTDELADLANSRAALAQNIPYGSATNEQRVQIRALDQQISIVEAKLATQASIYELCAGVTGQSPVPAQSLLNAAYTNTQNSLAAKYVEASLKQAMASARDIQAAAELPSSGKVENADFVLDLASGGLQITARWVIRAGEAFLVSKSGLVLAKTEGDLSAAALRASEAAFVNRQATSQTVQAELTELFSPFNPRNGIQIGNRSVLVDAEMSKGAKVFQGVNEAEVMDYFKRLTGLTELPKPRILEKGTLYDIKTPQGSFSLRNFADSNMGPNGGWTIDVPGKEIIGVKKTLELKFPR